MKSTENINLSTFTKIFSMISLGCLIDLSMNCKEIMVSFSSPSLNFLKTKKGNKLTLAPKLDKGLTK